MKIKPLFLLIIGTVSMYAQTDPMLPMEKLTRGLVALPSENGGQFISWRLFGTDPRSTTFDLLRDGENIARNLSNRTNFIDTQGTRESQYQIIVKEDGEIVEITDTIKPWTDYFKNIKLDRPSGGVYPYKQDKSFVDTPYSYYPHECSVGDVDGDGEYELFVKWTPTNAQDNAQSFGKTGNVYIDCYRMNGTKLWRVNLGINIRAGSHYTQFLVYDFNGDGRAEMICKTAPGSFDGESVFVNQASDEEEIRIADNHKDWRTKEGKIIGGHEYLTVFEGLTGKAIHTVFYNPNRNAEYGGEADGSFNWSDTNGEDKATYGNRGERYLATVAYLDGLNNRPSAVMCRGYYTYSFLWAVDFDGRKLSTKWLHGSKTKNKVERTDPFGIVETRFYDTNTFGTSNYYTAYGQGNHQIAAADVDADGCDEIIFGAATIDNDGWLLYSTGLGHGDRLHVGDLIPDRPGLEVFRCIEGSPYGCEIHDACTGEKLYHRTSTGDTGACIAADIDFNQRGVEFWASDSTVVLNSSLEPISYNRPNYHGFRIYWDGDLQDELFYRGKLDKWNGNGITRLYLNGKNFYDLGESGYADVGGATLQADLFGDWREELICWNQEDSTSINIFTTNIPSKYRVPTLMHDHYYRLAIARQNVCYNQMPMLGYFLPDADFSYQGELKDETAPDLTNYQLVVELDFENMGKNYITTTYPNEQKGTAWENGNKKQQKLYNTITPEIMQNILAFQGTYNGSGTKGWWISSNAGGLVTENATRSAAVLNLKKDDIVIFESTNCVDGTLTLTDGNGKPDGPFTFTRSDDATKFYCTMTADGQIGFCGARYYTGAIKNIKIYTQKANHIESPQITETDDKESDNTYYTIGGHKVSGSPIFTGVYIKNGRAIFVKE
jgi:rhamnogalacturonan endolyase